MFVPDIARRYDAIVAMYHDQGLPALKAASFGGGVNVTLGLPFVRTSVDHGTALDLAVDAGERARSGSRSRQSLLSLAASTWRSSFSRAPRPPEAAPQGMRRTMHVASRKRFGQNFLADPHYVARILDAVAPRQGDNVVEIGPGLAALTGGLIERAGRITAIEIDRDLAARLRTDFTPGNLTLHEADALDFDFATLGPRAAHRRQPAVQHQHAAPVPARRIRCRACATCT